jgi:hypothetical protein
MDFCYCLGGESKSTVSGYDRRNNNQVSEGERQVGDYREIMGREDDMSSSQNAAQNRFLGGTDQWQETRRSLPPNRMLLLYTL